MTAPIFEPSARSCTPGDLYKAADKLRQLARDPFCPKDGAYWLRIAATIVGAPHEEPLRHFESLEEHCRTKCCYAWTDLEREWICELPPDHVGGHVCQWEKSRPL